MASSLLLLFLRFLQVEHLGKRGKVRESRSFFYQNMGCFPHT